MCLVIVRKIQQIVSKDKETRQMRIFDKRDTTSHSKLIQHFNLLKMPFGHVAVADWPVGASVLGPSRRAIA
jgi:hypothetical protein